MSNTPNANDMMPSETPSNTTTTYRWARDFPTIASQPGASTWQGNDAGLARAKATASSWIVTSRGRVVMIHVHGERVGPFGIKGPGRSDRGCCRDGGSGLAAAGRLPAIGG